MTNTLHDDNFASTGDHLSVIVRLIVVVFLMSLIMGFVMRLFLPVTDPYPQGPTKESGYSLFVGITYWITCLAIGVFDMLQHIRASKRILFRTGLILALALTALWIPLVQWDHAILKKWRRIENQQQQESVLEQPRQGATRT